MNQSEFIIDIIHDKIYLSTLQQQIINSPEFKHLEKKLQLGPTRFAFPNATHTRYEHSIGVGHLASICFDTLVAHSQYAADREWCAHMHELIGIAGLVHDLGHSAFSHLFDHYVADDLGVPEHEERSVSLFRHIVKKYDLDLTATDIDIISNIVLGEPMSNYPRFLFQIVANHDFDLDVDKIDYLMRDTYYVGHCINIDYMRIFRHAQIAADGGLQFHKDVAQDIEMIFRLRYFLHDKIYQHPHVLAYGVLVAEMLKELARTNDWKKKFETYEWINIHDNIIYTIPKHHKNNERLVALYKQFSRGQIPDLIYYAANHSEDKRDCHVESDTAIHGDVADDMTTDAQADESVRIVWRVISLTTKGNNPFDKIMFYNDSGDTKHIRLANNVPILKKEKLCFKLTV